MTIERTTQSNDLEAGGKQTVDRERTRPGLTFRPDVDILELPKEFVVTADLAGVDESHVNVRLEEGVLHIDGELAVLPDPGWRLLQGEYRPGGYHRKFALSDAIDVEGIRASMRDGVLELHLPKTEHHRPRRIEVQAG